MSAISRRAFVSGGLMAAAVPFSDWFSSKAAAQQQPFVRPSAFSSQGKQALISYRKAVGIMLNRSKADPKDPLGWTAQYKMHKYPDNWDLLAPSQQPAAQKRELDQIFGPASPANTARTNAERTWGRCAHGTQDFLAWHRMYIFFFERIVRKLSGDPAFALPYWNYFKDTTIPVEFRSPASAQQNALYEDRQSDLNGAANPLTLGQVLQSQFGLPGLSTNFWQRRVLLANGNFQQLLEGDPHGIIHTVLGTDNKDMGFVGRSARDPIFWMHHCQIDRLWDGWIRSGNSNPTQTLWLDNAPAFFYDEDGNVVSLTNRDVIDPSTIKGQLGYRYDEPSTNPSGVSMAAMKTGGASETTIASGGEVAVSKERATTFTLKTPEGAVPFAAKDITQKRYLLTIEDLQVGEGAPVIFNIYLNPPPGEVSAKASAPSLAGGISTFGLGAEGGDGGHAGHGGSGKTVTLDITDAVQKLVAEGKWTGDPTVAVFVNKPGPNTPSIKFGKVSITEQSQ